MILAALLVLFPLLAKFDRTYLRSLSREGMLVAPSPHEEFSQALSGDPLGSIPFVIAKPRLSPG